jgi:hypothetical protein
VCRTAFSQTGRDDGGRGSRVNLCIILRDRSIAEFENPRLKANLCYGKYVKLR